MAEKQYSNRELDTKFTAIIEKLDEIHAQTSKTNGRVTKLERNMLVAFVVIVVTTALKFPEILSAIKMFI